MKNLFCSLLALLLMGATALTTQAQTTRRCNNSGITGANIYTTLQAAHDAASNGDFIYLEPTDLTYGNLNCTKRLTIIGSGYFLDQNPGLQLTDKESITGVVTFNTGSASSRIMGCYINSTLSVVANDVIVERNRISTTYIGYNGQTGATATISNTIIRHNYFEASLNIYPSSPNTVSNVNISNNIIIGGLGSSGQYTGMSDIIIAHNVIGNLAGNSFSGINLDNAVIKNNIMTYTSTGANFNPRNNSYSYNISGNAAFGTANGNQQNISPSAMFVGGTASTDGAFQLKAAPNPAIGTGDNGASLGAFGGPNPYRIAGIPSVPTIYQFNQSVSGNTLNATISTRSNN
ncbi:hypothetical protein SAMN02745146_2385 [Hymenobacter daecheongensis DSM 21074]|uniref:Right handed beta helix region n=1 Tax=Hymenobacter daecheongensis DSM 21074 TaxID=1121955 RepID=A0A1M6GTP8_9BACT|nr:hypothetical protein [Hymenobacter daecheongensis]SHJ13259.1 hypothetical protein SAMN02745146_2385 [Hymenobacter daecheongensis DSM 21074]